MRRGYGIPRHIDIPHGVVNHLTLNPILVGGVMGSYLICCTPAHGHVMPALTIARHLVDRGDRVRLLTGAKYRDRVIATGAEFLPIRPRPTSTSTAPASCSPSGQASRASRASASTCGTSSSPRHGGSTPPCSMRSPRRRRMRCSRPCIWVRRSSASARVQSDPRSCRSASSRSAGRARTSPRSARASHRLWSDRAPAQSRPATHDREGDPRPGPRRA